MGKVFVRDKYDGEWLFYINGQSELCYAKDGKEQILQENLRKDFDLVSGISRDFHITAQTDTGSLIYLTYDYSSWRKFTILGSKSSEGVMSRFKLIESEGILHSFYILDFKGKTILVHHIYDIATYPSPRVIGYADKGSEVSICGDADGNIHIFFIGVEGSMQYKVYNSRAKGYTDGKINTEDEIRSIFPVCAKDGHIHFLYTARLKTYYALVYMSSPSGERKIISFGDSNVTDICMFTDNDTIYIQWRERGVYYQCISSDRGTTFKKPTSINQIRGRAAELVKEVTSDNSMSFGGDYRVAYCKGTEIEFAGGVKKKKEADNHKIQDIAYNNSGGIYAGETAYLAERIAKQEKEIIRISTALQSLTDKVAQLTKGLMSSPHPLQKSVYPPPLNDVSSIQVNKDNIKSFEDMGIEDVDFANSKKF